MTQSGYELLSAIDLHSTWHWREALIQTKIEELAQRSPAAMPAEGVF